MANNSIPCKICGLPMSPLSHNTICTQCYNLHLALPMDGRAVDFMVEKLKEYRGKK